MDLLDKLGQHFFGWFFPWLSLTAAGWLWLAWKRGNASLHWPTAPGEILSSRVEHDDGSYLPKLKYRYWVDGRAYTGDTVTYCPLNTDKKTAGWYIARFPERSPVAVYYDPRSPKVSVLEPGVQPAAFLAPIVVLTVLFAVGLAMRIAAMF